MKRIGVIIPETNLVVESEIYKLYEYNIISSNDVIFHFLRIPFETRYSKDDNKFLNEIIENQKVMIKNLKLTNLDHIYSFCTSAGAIEEKKISLCYNSADSIIEAVKKMKVGKSFLITPYNENIGNKVEEFLERKGGKVIKSIHLDLLHSIDYVDYGYERLLDLIISEYNEECDNVIISCTNFPTLHLINNIENRLNTKVVSSNYSMFWKIFIDNEIIFDTKKMGFLFNCR